MAPRCARSPITSAAASPLKRASELLQLSPGRVSEACSPYHDQRWLSLLHVAELEACSGAPLVARALADLAGFDLVPRDAEHAQPSPFAMLASVTRETGEASSALAEALADGRIDDLERARIIREAMQAIESLQALVAAMKPKPREAKEA